MKLLKMIFVIFVGTLLVWGVQAMYLTHRNSSIPSQIEQEQEAKRRNITLEFKKRERELEKELETKKYLATGKTVYDRIFNTQNQDVTDLIRKIAREALPNNWSYKVEVEEFTHFILLIYLPPNALPAEPTNVVSHLVPVLKYCSQYVKDVAVFDKTHKSYLFFDDKMLEEIEKHGNLTSAMVERARQQGASFTRFNSMTIHCETHESHLFLPVEVSGPSGVVTCYALFDTGASTTMVANRIISETGVADLSTAPCRSFDTANGMMSCPIIRREVNVGGYRKNIEVAVNQRDELNLLGVNFFEGMHYIVDFQNSCIYVWVK